MGEVQGPIPFQLAGIDHIVFAVDDLQKAVRFYEDVLGCHPGYSYPQLGMEQVWAGNALIVLWDYTHPGGKDAEPPVKGGRNLDHVCLAASPFDHQTLRDHLAARNGWNNMVTSGPRECLTLYWKRRRLI